MTKGIYIASPYSHKYAIRMREREEWINSIAAKLHVIYDYLFFLPITQSAPLQRKQPSLGGCFAKWKKRDLEAIRRMDEVWVVTLPGWDKSVGVKAEIAYAKKYKKPVYYIDPITKGLIPTLKPSIEEYINA